MGMRKTTAMPFELGSKKVGRLNSEVNKQLQCCQGTGKRGPKLIVSIQHPTLLPVQPLTVVSAAYRGPWPYDLYLQNRTFYLVKLLQEKPLVNYFSAPPPFNYLGPASPVIALLAFHGSYIDVLQAPR